MKTLKKVLTIISCLCFSLAISLNVFGASASTVGGVEVGSFTMENGAWIRVDENSGNGIKFNAFLDTETYDTLEGLENATVNYGMVIVPNDMLPEDGITTAMLLDTANNHFTNEECNCGKTHYAIVEYETLTDNPDADNKILRGSIVNIKTGNVVRPYTAVGYIKYVGDTTEYALAEYANGDIANSTRSMAYVAQKAIDAGQDADGNIEATYVTPYTTGDYANKFPYTVNHYLNGKDQAPVTEKLYGTLGETVNAKHILNSTVEKAKELYKAYGLYGFTNDSVSSSVLYADGKTVLNVYYEEMDTSFKTVVNDPDYFLMGANKNLPGATTTWHDEITLNGETKEGVVQINTTAVDEYTAGKFRMAFNRNDYFKAVEMGYSYVKLHMYIVADSSLTKINFLSKNNKVVSDVPTGQWVDVIVPLSELNRTGGYLSGLDGTKAKFEEYAGMDGYGWNSSSKDFLCTNSVKNGIGLTTTNMTYYIDEVSWGIDFDAPEITISGIAPEMFEGTFTEPTVTATDNMTVQTMVNTTVVKTLYKVDGDTRTEVAFVDGKVDLTKGNYVYVVTADDRIYSDVVGNVATKEVEFAVVERQDLVITFDSAEDANYIQSTPNKVYYSNSTYLDADALAAENLNSGDVAPEGGAIKFVAGMEGSTDANGTNGAQKYGAWLVLKLSAEEIAQVKDATAITFRMYVHPSSYPSWGYTDENGITHEVQLLDGSTGSGKIPTLAAFNRNAWVEFTVDVSNLTYSLDKYLNGTYALFWTSTNTMYKNDGIITYYINSITFDVTP